MTGKILKKLSIFLFLIMLVSVSAGLTHTTRAAEAQQRYITITLHAGENGYFSDPSVTEKTTVQFAGDVFEDDTVPDNSVPGMMFLGWATEENMDDPNVISGMTNCSVIGSDLYAVWTDMCEVYYTVNDGYILMDDGSEYQAVLMKYSPGQYFQPLDAYHFGDSPFVADGWYTGAYSIDGGTECTEETLITGPYLDVHVKWKLSEDLVDFMQTDRDYPLQITGHEEYLAFRPEETATYEIITKDNADPDDHAYIVMMDADQNVLMESTFDKTTGNATLSSVMEAGRTYFFALRETGGDAADFTAVIRKADCVRVTFHINRPGMSDVWFDNDPSSTEKTIEIRKGEKIGSYSHTGITISDPKITSLIGWSGDPDAEWKDDSLTADRDMDVYGIYADLSYFIIDAGEGYFPMENNASVIRYVYFTDMPFIAYYDPHISDVTKKFAGWSRDPNATKPDEDIIEGVTLCEEIGDTLYAVYDEKLMETFDANGGYMMDNPGITTYTSSKGKGHIFYGMALMHQDPRMVPIGWRDQNGVFIPYTSNIYPYYHIEEDTVYTAVWGYKVIVDANGGYFPEIGTAAVSVAMECGGTFSLEEYREDLGEMVNLDGTLYLAGWATSPEAKEPDVFEGKTPVEGLDRVYAVWKKDSYRFTEGAGSVWTTGSSEGLRFVIKRTGDDRETYGCFTGAEVDGETITADDFETGEGSLILTLKPGYLSGLTEGKHELTVRFGEDSVSADFITAPPREDAPYTGYGGHGPVLMILVTVCALMSAISIMRRKSRA